MDRLETMHTKGFLHLDLKPQNILLGSSSRKNQGSSKIFLIDFGVSKTFLDESGLHLPKIKGVPFGGNMLFASPNAFRNLCKY